MISGIALEPVVISPATPAINTSQQPATAVVGSSVADKATVTGGFNPTGTVTFNLYNNPNGTGTPLFTDTETLVGGSATSAGYTATATGTDYWVATYNGDSKNKSVSSGTALEPVTITPATPSINTTPGMTTVVTGPGQYATIGFWHNKNGQAVITNFNGSSSSKLLANSLATSDANLFGYSNPYISGSLPGTPAPGTAGGLAGLTNAQVATVYENLWTPSGLQKNTYVQAFAVGLGGYTTSSAATFNVGSNGTAFGVTNNTSLSVAQILQTVSANFNPTTGLFYSGDSTKTSAANNVLDGINTSGESGGLGSVVTVAYLNDSATLSGGYHETGSLTFYLFAPGVTPNGTNSNNAYHVTVTVNGDGTYSTPSTAYTPAALGTYQWVVVYAGDGNNSQAISPFGSEPWTVGQQSPTITTVPGGTVVIGSGAKLTDSATLSDGVSPTGTITFYLFAPGVTPNATNSNNVFTDTVTVNGNGTYTTAGGTTTGSALPTVTGTYQWVAVYSGDTNNVTATSSFGDEPETVTPSGPSLTTTPGGTVTIGSITINGTKYLDLTGNGFSSDDTPKSGVTINLYQGGTGPGTPGDTLVATTTTASDGTYSFGLTSPGTYYVQESVPSGYVQTGGGPNGSAGNTYYTVVTTVSHSYSGYKFDDFLIPTCTETNVSYKVTTPGGTSTTVTSLAGNTAPGDTVTVTFTVPSGMSDTMTLVSYSNCKSVGRNLELGVC